MDPFLRGFNEHLIDSHLEELAIQNMKGIVQIFGLGIKSKLDAQLGFFLGYSYAKLTMQFLILKNRVPTKEETENYFELIKRRFPEVVSTFKKEKISKISENNGKITPVKELDIDPLDRNTEE
jgi:hypothetical protein